MYIENNWTANHDDCCNWCSYLTAKIPEKPDF